MHNLLDLVGIGVGPFNLSLAALLGKTPQVKNVFLDRKERFEWHSEIMFPDSVMQTNYLKDLVTPVDPTSPYSFLNHLLDKNLFYAFINTQRTNISRREFEKYCVWVSEKLGERVRFSSEVRYVSHKDNAFKIETSNGEFYAKNICVATGLVPRIPVFAQDLVGDKIFHAKSPHLKRLDVTGKSVVIVGGGQTGIEVFKNLLDDKWGRARSIRLLTRRQNLEPLDESAFSNEYFTPSYANAFWDFSIEKKAALVARQKLASDGNTPAYLLDLYNQLYRLQHVEGDPRSIRVHACRNLTNIERRGAEYLLTLENQVTEKRERLQADIVILSTGFKNAIPPVLEPLFPRIDFDSQGRFQFEKSYAVKWDGPRDNKIYALNFSRHSHGIVDPQTSLMAWRSAMVVNDLVGEKIYKTDPTVSTFVDFDGATGLIPESFS